MHICVVRVSECVCGSDDVCLYVHSATVALTSRRCPTEQTDKVLILLHSTPDGWTACVKDLAQTVEVCIETANNCRFLENC